MIEKMRNMRPWLAAVLLVTAAFLWWNALSASEPKAEAYQMRVREVVNSPAQTTYVLESTSGLSRVRSAVVYGKPNTMRKGAQVTITVER